MVGGSWLQVNNIWVKLTDRTPGCRDEAVYHPKRFGTWFFAAFT